MTTSQATRSSRRQGHGQGQERSRSPARRTEAVEAKKETDSIEKAINELGINLAEEARKRKRKVMERYSKNVKDKIKKESYMTKDKEEAKMLSEQKQPNNMKPFRVDENRAEMNHILNEREDVIIMIKF
jgi:hypothetical protein